MISAIVDAIVNASTELLENLPSIFTTVMEVLYDTTNSELTVLGEVIVATAGFALAWAGIRFVFGFVSRLLNISRASA